MSTSDVEWTEEDKGAYVRFAQDIRDLREYTHRARFMRVEVPTSDVDRRLQVALDRLGAR